MSYFAVTSTFFISVVIFVLFFGLILSYTCTGGTFKIKDYDGSKCFKFIDYSVLSEKGQLETETISSDFDPDQGTVDSEAEPSIDDVLTTTLQSAIIEFGGSKKVHPLRTRVQLPHRTRVQLPLRLQTQVQHRKKYAEMVIYVNVKQNGLTGVIVTLLLRRPKDPDVVDQMILSKKKGIVHGVALVTCVIVKPIGSRGDRVTQRH